MTHILRSLDSAHICQYQKSKTLRKPSFLYGTKEERERKSEDRKFSIVVSRIDDSGILQADAQQLEAETARVELPAAEYPRAFEAELSGDMDFGPKELATLDDQAKEDLADVYCQVSELPADVPAELNASLPADLDKVELQNERT